MNQFKTLSNERENVNLNSRIDIISLVTGLTQMIFNHEYNSTEAKLSTEEFVYECMGILQKSIEIPCPECHKLIPLNLDEVLIAGMVISWLDSQKDISKLKAPSLDAIKKTLIEDSGAHPIECKNLHSPQCHFAALGFMTLDDLLDM